MFHKAAAFNGDVSLWNTSSVRDMSGMFAHANSFNRDLSQWNTGNVQDMFSMFQGQFGQCKV